MKELITANLDIWSAAVTAKTTGAGRSSGNKGAYGINKLRELILELAVRGKLVPQDPKDEPASELLKKIRIEKTKLTAVGKTRKDKPLTPISETECPFDLPAGWEWVTLDYLAINSEAGWSPQCEGYPRSIGKWGVLKVSAISWGVYNPDENKELPSGLEPRPEYEVKAGDFLISRANTAELVAKAVVVPHGAPPKLIISDKIIRFKFSAFTNLDFIQLVNNSNHARGYYATVAGGTSSSMKNVSRNQIRDLLFALPPLPEQHRIVAKVDELMALCDQLEAEQANSADAHEKLVSILLDALTQGDNFTESWERIQEHFDVLFTTPASIKKFKQTLLQLAVMGKLVPQDANDEPASELLKKIAVEKVRLSKQSNIKNQIVFPEITEDEKPFDIPECWSWSTVQTLSRPKEIVTYGILKPVWVDDGVPTVRISEMGKGVIEVDALRNCDPVRASKFEKTRLISGDLLITKDGTIGKTAFVPPELEGGNITQHVLRFSINDNVDRYFIRLCIDAPMSQRWMAGETKGVALKGVNVGDFRRMPLPIPPLKEQQRIVAKFDELMALCDQLKSQLVEAGEQQRKLADVMVERAVA